MDNQLVMETIEFGEFYINEDLEKGMIEWLVLDEDEESLFLVSKKAVACRYFDNDGNQWEKSEIRKWLNEEFLNEAFEWYEKPCILTTNVTTTCFCEETRIGNYNADVHTQDRVFLLSAEELEKYFPEQASRIQVRTDFATSALENKRKNTNAWWLRNEGLYDAAVMLVLEDGSLIGYAGCHNIEGIRPVMRICKNYCDFLVSDDQLSLFELQE